MLIRKMLGLAFLVASFSALTACRPPAEPYNANTAVVGEMGEKAALGKMRKLLSQAAAPQVQAQSVDVAPEYFFYQALDIAMYGRGFISKKVFFKEIQGVELWESRGHTYIKFVGAGDKKLDQLKWTSATDAKDFADIVMSFKAGGGGASAPADAPGDAPEKGEPAEDGAKAL